MTSTSTDSGHSLTPEEEVMLNKLEMLKELKDLTPQYNEVIRKLRAELELTEQEEKCLGKYKEEYESLVQEKMAHVEELRLIHADINQMESVIKQSEQEHNNHYKSSKHLYKEFQNLKESMNRYRGEIGLTCLPDLPEIEEQIKRGFFNKLPDYPGHGSSNSMGDHHHHHGVNSSLMAPGSIPQSYFASASAVHRGNGGKPMPGTPGSLGLAGYGSTALHPNPSHSVPVPGNERPPAPSSFRQQPPPMKSCLSCHQQIHRNAPICPLCKAKSKSRNPKKPKKKIED
ncbi:zinc finger C4H2 domain-containing protein [Brevipalpus obovatus]|uniref:zinc finger C4H2 domain-containing protein n=1 Tax=Brevipalpus obovatus TaxID=246614 RepID=UPI003D9E5DB0